MNFRLAVKAVIINDHKLLILRRRPNDVHKPGQWDLPGGRLEPGENPWDGIKRETLEETGLEVQPLLPFDIHHFTREDQQAITMIFFLCQTSNKDVQLSEEHTEYLWADSTDTGLPDWITSVLRKISEYQLIR